MSEAYREHLLRNDAAQTPEDVAEGYAVWFDPGLPPPAGPALDFAAGLGQGLDYLAGRGFSGLEAWEPDPTLADGLRAQGRTVHAQPDPEAFLAGVTGRYALILAKDVLEHLAPERIEAVTRALVAALRPGGRLLVSVPHAVSFVGLYQRYGDFTHRTSFTAPSLRYLLERVGLERVACGQPRFRLKLRPQTLVYRGLKRAWHGCLRAIYWLENPNPALLPPHFHPRLVMWGDRRS